MRRVTRLVTGAVAATSLVLCADSANADPVNWDAVARCESGGNWSANTGNGDYGGLQITQSTWDANGGVGSPASATPQQQIAVANQILITQGPGAWPTCMSQARSRTPANAPVGSLTQLLTALIDNAQGYSAPVGG